MTLRIVVNDHVIPVATRRARARFASATAMLLVLFSPWLILGGVWLGRRGRETGWVEVDRAWIAGAYAVLAFIAVCLWFQRRAVQRRNAAGFPRAGGWHAVIDTSPASLARLGTVEGVGPAHPGLGVLELSDQTEHHCRLTIDGGELVGRMRVGRPGPDLVFGFDRVREIRVSLDASGVPAAVALVAMAPKSSVISSNPGPRQLPKARSTFAVSRRIGSSRR